MISTYIKKTQILCPLLFVFVLFLTICIRPAPADAVLYDGIRPLGMGNAFTAVADDENAVFYNPAGLSMMSGLQLGVVNPQIEIADDSIDFADDAGDVDFDNTSEVADLLRKYTGKPQHVRVGLFPHLGLNIKDVGVLVGALGQGTVDVEINNPVWPQTRVNLIADYGPIVGGGFQLPAVKNLHLGMSLKYIGRESLSEVYTPAEIAASLLAEVVDVRSRGTSDTGSGEPGSGRPLLARACAIRDRHGGSPTRAGTPTTPAVAGKGGNVTVHLGIAT